MKESQNKRIRAAVVGVGYYGSFHAEKYATLPGCELVAVVDRNPASAERAAVEYEVPSYSDHRELYGKVDVASVVVPANDHYRVARDLIEAGIHVLVEKPVTNEVAEAEELIELAQKHNVVFQVGHLERFNPAYRALPEEFRAPTYVESHRLTPFPKRNADVSVVLDLMIHDIDLVLDLIPSPVKSIQAKGVSVFSDDLDVVNALIYFESGAVANLTASRASTEPQRILHLFQQNAHVTLDLHKKHLSIQHRTEGDANALEEEHISCENEDILRTEVNEFLEAVRGHRAPAVSGQDGLMALATANHIMSVVDRNETPMEPLAIVSPGEGGDMKAHVRYDAHPETQKAVFSRRSLVFCEKFADKETL